MCMWRQDLLLMDLESDVEEYSVNFCVLSTSKLLQFFYSGLDNIASNEHQSLRSVPLNKGRS